MKGSHVTFAKRKYQKVPSQRRETWAKNGPKIGTPKHGAMIERSLIFYNSKRAKMTPPLKRIRSAANSPVSSPIH